MLFRETAKLALFVCLIITEPILINSHNINYMFFLQLGQQMPAESGPVRGPAGELRQVY